MLRITEYGERIRDEFIEHCKDCSKYDIAMDYGLDVLNDCVRGTRDYAALCIMNYDTMAIDTVEEWFAEATSPVCWSTNGDDLENAFIITFGSLRDILNRCFEEEERDDMSIQITFTGEEVSQLEKIFGDPIEDKEDLYQTIREVMADILNKNRKVI